MTMSSTQGELSTVSAKLENAPSKENSKMKEVARETSPTEPKSCPTLPNFVEEVHGSNLPLNLLGFLKEEEASIPALRHETSSEARGKEPEKRYFSCKFCDKKFSNSQALGGHQNAHKHERAVRKREKVIYISPAFNHMDPMSYPYSVMAAGSLHGLSKTLGVQPHSAIHKPHHNAWPCGGFGHGYQGWQRQSNNVNLHPNVLQSQNPGATMHHPQHSQATLLQSQRLAATRPLDVTGFTNRTSDGGVSGGSNLIMGPFPDTIANGVYHQSSSSSQIPQSEAPGVLDLSLKL